MIRVNLLPIKKARRRSAARNQLLLFAALILVELAVCTVIYLSVSNRLESLKAELNRNQQLVQQAEEAEADAIALDERQQKLAQQLEVLQDLEGARTGPVRMLDELQAMLSPPRSTEEGYAQARRNWNTEWDTRRLWVQSLKESGEGFEMTGYAVNADDVAEFLQRLTTANYVFDIQLDYVKATNPGGGGGATGRMVEFHVVGGLSYTGKQAGSSAEES